jgi:predicted site-specific integrase-resolvase
MWVKAGEVTDRFKISNTTLCTWARCGKIQRKSVANSKYFLYNIAPLIDFNTKHVIYARVSTTKQKNDLDEQVKILKSYVVSNGNIISDVFTDIASGMNENRIGLINLNNLITEGDIHSVLYIL